MNKQINKKQSKHNIQTCFSKLTNSWYKSPARCFGTWSNAYLNIARHRSSSLFRSSNYVWWSLKKNQLFDKTNFQRKTFANAMKNVSLFASSPSLKKQLQNRSSFEKNERIFVAHIITVRRLFRIQCVRQRCRAVVRETLPISTKNWLQDEPNKLIFFFN